MLTDYHSPHALAGQAPPCRERQVRCLSAGGPRSQTLAVAEVGHAPMFLDAGQMAIARDLLLAA